MSGRRISSQLLTARVSALAVSAAVSWGAWAATTVTPAEAGVQIGSNIRSQSLSDELRTTQVAYARRSAPIRSGPHRGSKTLARLDFLTSHGQAMPYIALTKLVRTPGSDWTEIRIPGRPNGQKGWVRTSALGPFRAVYGRLVVNRAKLKATLYGRKGDVRWRAPIGIGRPGLGTPGGQFWITERLRAIGGPAYGPYAFGTSAYAPHLTDWPGGGVIGIHGTNQPGLIPGRPSHGCIRLRNPAIRVLWRKLDVGTSVRIK